MVYGNMGDDSGTGVAFTRNPNTGEIRRLTCANFEVDDTLVADFKKYLGTREVKIDEEAWAKDQDFIRAMIRYNIDEAVFDIATARQRLVTVDPQALERCKQRYEREGVISQLGVPGELHYRQFPQQ